MIDEVAQAGGQRQHKRGCQRHANCCFKTVARAQKRTQAEKAGQHKIIDEDGRNYDENQVRDVCRQS